MSGIINTSKFPWLCSTTAALSDDHANRICENEAEEADNATLDAYGLFGIKCTYYYVAEDIMRDKLFGEDQLRQIMRSWYFMGYVQSLPPNVRTYQLEGIWGEDMVTMYASISAFNYYSTYGGYDKNTPEVYELCKPKIGDIIYMNPNEVFYRIVDVKYYSEAFGLTKHTYTLTLKVYKDNKYSINSESPTLSNRNDPIYRVANYSLQDQYQINDMLKLNHVEETTDSVNTMDTTFNEKEIKEENPKYYDPFGGW